VIRLANDNTGDAEDGLMFDKLQARFKSNHAAGALKYAGFDIGNGKLIFYFKGPESRMVQDTVLSLLADCKFRFGYNFEIN
jgi:hypothetical protein